MNATNEKFEPQFFRVGSSVVKDGALRAMTSAELRVLMVLSLHANWRTGKCWPSYRTIRDLSGCSRTSISSAVQGLVKLGAISVQKEKVKNGRRNVYTVFRTLQASPRTQSRTADDPPAKKNHDVLGRFQSSRTDDPRSRTTDDPRSSRVDQNDINLNENEGTRSKEVAPPAPSRGSDRAPEDSARPSLPPSNLSKKISEVIELTGEHLGPRGALKPRPEPVGEKEFAAALSALDALKDDIPAGRPGRTD